MEGHRDCSILQYDNYQPVTYHVHREVLPFSGSKREGKGVAMKEGTRSKETRVRAVLWKRGSW